MLWDSCDIARTNIVSIGLRLFTQDALTNFSSCDSSFPSTTILNREIFLYKRAGMICERSWLRWRYLLVSTLALGSISISIGARCKQWLDTIVICLSCWDLTSAQYYWLVESGWWEENEDFLTSANIIVYLNNVDSLYHEINTISRQRQFSLDMSGYTHQQYDHTIIAIYIMVFAQPYYGSIR